MSVAPPRCHRGSHVAHIPALGQPHSPHLQGGSPGRGREASTPAALGTAPFRTLGVGSQSPARVDFRGPGLRCCFSRPGIEAPSEADGSSRTPGRQKAGVTHRGEESGMACLCPCLGFPICKTGTIMTGRWRARRKGRVGAAACQADDTAHSASAASRVPSAACV